LDYKEGFKSLGMGSRKLSGLEIFQKILLQGYLMGLGYIDHYTGNTGAPIYGVG